MKLAFLPDVSQETKAWIPVLKLAFQLDALRVWTACCPVAFLFLGGYLGWAWPPERAGFRNRRVSRWQDVRFLRVGSLQVSPHSLERCLAWRPVPAPRA